MKNIVQLELIRESLVAVVNEMRANIIHSSYAAIIYEGHDFSCALMSADGRQIAQGLADHPIHIFAVPYSTRKVVEVFGEDIHEGDLFLHNDPYTGGTHLNDVLLLQPIFYDDKLSMFAAMRCHWNDVGGMTPGSLSGRVKEIYQEGIRIAPTKISQRGTLNEGMVELLFNNMRGREERLGDFNAMLGTGRKAEEHIGRLFNRFGGQSLLDGIEELIFRSEKLMRSKIKSCPDGEYFAEGYCESDGSNPEPLIVKLKLMLEGDSITADFSGTSKQTNGPTNCGPAMAFNAVGTIVKAFLDPYTPINHGSFNPITVNAPEGSFINAREPAPCGGMAEVKFLIDSVVASAMGQIVPEMAVGDLKGGANHVHIAGPRLNGSTYIHYEWPAGGTGASKGIDGGNAVRSYNEGDFNSIQSVETVEKQYPLRVEACEIREGSCGDGEYRGGFGLRRDIRILNQSAMLSVLSEKNVIPPYGVFGGGNGAANRFIVLRKGKTILPSDVPGKVSGFQLLKDDVVREETAGGGGYGDPLDRETELVHLDVKHEYLNKNQAEKRYGVIFNETGSVNQDATIHKRSKIKEQRVILKIQMDNNQIHDGARRVFLINRENAKMLGVSEGGLIEIIGVSCAPLRGWIKFDENAEYIVVGTDGGSLLNLVNGDLVEIRPVVSLPETVG